MEVLIAPPRPAKVGAALAFALGVLLARLPARGAEPAPRPVPIVDLHVDLSYQNGYEGKPFERGTGQFPARELVRAGVVGVVLPLFVPKSVSPGGPRKEDLETSYARVFGELVRTPPYALPGCLAPPDRVRTWLAFEGAGPLADDPDALASWIARGVRSVGLVHTRANALASSSGDPKPEAFGLTERGRAFVQKAHEYGVSIDVSHASSRALADVVALATAAGRPVLATHSDARKLADHPRNLSDAELRGVAGTGGIVGVNFHALFLTGKGAARMSDVVREVLYLARTIGIEHVAIGSDFEGDITAPVDLTDVRAMPALAEALVAAGLTRSDVERVFAKNALRILCRKGEGP